MGPDSGAELLVHGPLWARYPQEVSSPEEVVLEKMDIS